MSIYGNKLIIKIVKNNNIFDKDLTLKKCEQAILEYDKALKLEEKIIAEAVKEVFTKSDDKVIDFAALKVFAVNTSKLQSVINNHIILTNKVGNYIRRNSQGKNIGTKDKPIYENSDYKFFIEHKTVRLR